MIGSLQQYNLSLQIIARGVGLSKTQVDGILKGVRKASQGELQKIWDTMASNGLPPDKILLFPCFSKGDSTMLRQLLEKDIFSPSLSERKEVFESESFRIALGAIKEAITLKKFIAVIGETGAGKTNLIRVLEEINFTDNKITISNLNNHDFERVNLRNIYEAVLFDIQPDAMPKNSTERLIRQVKQVLISTHKEGKKVILVVDEAHHVRKKTLLALKDVWDSTHGFSRLLGIVLLGQEPLAQRLDEPAVIECDSRIERIYIKSVTSAEECKAYVTHLCALRGVKLDNTITDDAYKAIYQRKSNFLGVNTLIKQAIEVAIRAGSKSLTDKHFRNI